MDRRRFLLGSSAVAALLGSGTVFAAVIDPVKTRVRVPGASAPITILDDKWGIPHIRAETKADAYFGQGYVVARDRLFQLDMERRKDLGMLAEAFGPKFVAHDHAARLGCFRGDVDAELAAMPAEVVACVNGYVEGINARIAELEADPSKLPLEYDILKIRPLRWTLRDLVRLRSAGLGDVVGEVRRARLAARGLLEQDQLTAPLAWGWKTKVPEGLDAAAVSEADFGILGAASGALPFSAEMLALYDPIFDEVDRAAHGSNAWTIAASRSATGRPILANDPHLGIGGAGPRHFAHLTAPGLDVIGGGSPGLPGIMQGHTDHFAFGRTNFHIDQQDLFIVETQPGSPENYRHNGEWKPFATVTETIKVKDQPDQTVRLKYAAQGPVISQDPARNRAAVLCSVSLRPGANMSFAIVAINLAKDWASLREAVRLHVSPTNLHYADVLGNTAWQTIGYAPVRPRHDGLLPAPGDGSYDWTGVMPLEKMPMEFNPKKGWFATANEMNIPKDYPGTKQILSFTWSAPFRYNRIAEVMATQTKHSLADSVKLQHDEYSIPARTLIPLLPTKLTGTAAQAAAMLRGWDFQLGADSAPAALYEMVWTDLHKSFVRSIVPEGARDLIKSIDGSQLVGLLTKPDARFGPNPTKARDDMLAASLAAGWAEALRVFGTDPAAWRWGDAHRVVIKHPLSSLPKIAAAFPVIDGGRSGGDGFTVKARGYVPTRSFNVSHGASMLLVTDVGNWDNSLILNLPGQSADPRSSHYRDYYAPWIAGDMQPLPFSKAAVDAQVRQVTVLEK
jgi:penicillin amidase